MKQQLVRLFFPYGSTRRVVRGPARGVRFLVEPGIGFTYAIGTDLAAPRCFEPRIRPGMTVYDVGGNKGQMALLFASLVGPTGRVVSFEPAPAEFTSLVRNVEMNSFEHVRCVQAAAAESEGELTFAYDSDHPTQGKLLGVEPSYASAGATSFPVRTAPLDSLLNDEPPPDVIKIDVEGAAASVFRGARRILEEVRPAIYIELHGPEEQVGVREEVISRGYVAETPEGKTVADPAEGWHSPLWCYHPSGRGRG